MKPRKETNYNQLHTLWIRIWDFIFKLIDELDGEKVHDAITNSESEFWQKLAQAFEALKFTLEVTLHDRMFSINIGDGLKASDIFESMRKDPEFNYLLLRDVGGFDYFKNMSVPIAEKDSLLHIQILEFSDWVNVETFLEYCDRLNLTIPNINSVPRLFRLCKRSMLREDDELAQLLYGLCFVNEADLTQCFEYSTDGMCTCLDECSLNNNERYKKFAVIKAR